MAVASGGGAGADADGGKRITRRNKVSCQWVCFAWLIAGNWISCTGLIWHELLCIWLVYLAVYTSLFIVNAAKKRPREISGTDGAVTKPPKKKPKAEGLYILLA